jgi:hypothetical protein
VSCADKNAVGLRARQTDAAKNVSEILDMFTGVLLSPWPVPEGWAPATREADGMPRLIDDLALHRYAVVEEPEPEGGARRPVENCSGSILSIQIKPRQQKFREP